MPWLPELHSEVEVRAWTQDTLLPKAEALRPAGLRLYAFQRSSRAGILRDARLVPVAFSDGADNEEREPDVLYQWRRQAEEERCSRHWC